jgi:carbon monoxide dehydrogenase subunit G
VATRVEETIEVDVPVSTAYNQWTQFESFPEFMGGVQRVEQTSPTTTHWVAEVGGIKREWDAAILEQVPDTKVAWAATQGATNAGAVYFAPIGVDRTSVRLTLEYEPEGLVEKAGDALNVVERRAKADLEKFKAFIESRGTETGAWRGAVAESAGVGTPGVEDAALSRGDSGSAGVTKGAAVAGAALLAGAAAAGVAAARSHKSEDEDEELAPGTTLPTAPAATTAPADAGVAVETGTAAQTGTAAETDTAPEPVDPYAAEAGLAGTPMLDEPPAPRDRGV